MGILEILAVVGNVLKVVFGLGFVIFLHELGHFLAAKWAGVKVEKFYLGFDPGGLRLASFRYGETVYGIGLIPLGGYVKMLGESPEEGVEDAHDPRAFSNKSVGARSVILSAGVAMNILLGFALFSIVQRLGYEETPARIGGVQAGSPAYEAGMKPGDDVLTIDGQGDVDFQRLRLRVSLSRKGQARTFVVKRPGVDLPIRLTIVPRRPAKGDMPNIGVREAASLVLAKDEPFLSPPGIDGPPPAKAALVGGGTVVAAGPSGGDLAPVADAFELHKVFAANRETPVDVRVEAVGEQGASPTLTVATLPVVREMTLGLAMTPGPVASIQAGSIAEKAGFRVGDRIVKVDGRGDYDPIRLPEDLEARAGKATTFAVERLVAGKAEPVAIVATPDASPTGLEGALGGAVPLKIPGLGLAIAIAPKVAAVAPGSPAEKAGIKPGAVLKEITIPPAKDDGPDAKPIRLVFGPVEGKPRDVVEAAWPHAYDLLQALSPRDVQLSFAESSAPITLRPVADPSRPSRLLRGLSFYGVTRQVEAQEFGPALRRGWEQTVDNILMIYATIRSLVSGQVSPKNLAGGPRIFAAAYQTASHGIVPLLGFLAMLSINLAVLNFLPIPPLDGGQIAFLVAEKIRGKPLPETTLYIGMIAGFVLVISLMLYTIIQDIILMIF